MNFYIEILGCSRNWVDGESMKEHLLEKGFVFVDDPSKASLILITTCSFIDSAVTESVDVVLNLSKFKNEGTGVCEKLIVIGCLVERFREKMTGLFPEVDLFLGTGTFDRVASIIKDVGKSRCVLPDPNNRTFLPLVRRDLKPTYKSYLKIAEGCNGSCSYCIIPKLRGRQRSKDLNHILLEAEMLIAAGTKEITLIAQDTTNYGRDLPGAMKFDSLLSSLAELSDDVWIRFLYGHPENITDSTIDVIANHNNLCPYFDLPIQHVAAGVVKNMGRKFHKKYLLSLLKKIRRNVRGATLRTSLIVGFPGETEDDFAELIEFINLIKFDNLGVFTYSDFDDLPSHYLPNHVDAGTALFRRDVLMSKQVEISRANLSRFVGEILDILIESCVTANLFKGRSMMQAPEVDGDTYVYDSKERKIKVGSLVSVKIVKSLEYDLIGEVL